MKMYFIKTVFSVLIASSLVVSSHSHAAEGSSVGNGGGLSENALMLARKHYDSLLKTCLEQPLCNDSVSINDVILFLLGKNLPGLSDFQFGDETTVPELKDPLGHKLPYYYKSTTKILIFNREFLYSSGSPLHFSTAVTYLTRVYLDLYGKADFEKSLLLVKPLEKLSKSTGEKISVGKDSLHLPFKEWIRLQTVFSSLVLESSKSLLSLSCPSANISTCSLTNSETSDVVFKDLSLVSEKLESELLEFEVQGHIVSKDQPSQFFTLRARYKDGILVSMEWQGQTLEIPADLNSKIE